MCQNIYPCSSVRLSSNNTISLKIGCLKRKYKIHDQKPK